MKIAFVGTNSTNIFPKLIKWFTKSQWTHVMLVLDETRDGDSIVIEASAKHGISITLLSKFNGRPMELFQDKLDIWSIDSIKSYIGNTYGYLQLFGIALVKIFKLKKNPFSKDEVCSELVLGWLLSTPYSSKFKDLDKNITSPEDLYRIIKQDPNFERVT